MNIQSRYRLSIALCLLAGFGAAIGICSFYQSVSSKPIFPIDKDTLTITRVDRPGNSEI